MAEEFVETSQGEVPSSTSSLSDISDEDDFEPCKDLLQLQKILPEEVWRIIGEKVIKNQNELFQNFGFLINSSPYFRKLLESKRVLYLFEQVFLIGHPWILATSPDDKGNPSDSDSETNWETVDEDSDADSTDYNQPELPKQKSISVIKTCREVCSVWNLSVDEILFEQVIARTKKRRHSIEHKYLTNVEFQRFENASQVNKFLNFFKDTHPKGITGRSPFISREVKIFLSCDADGFERDPGFPKAFEALLEAYAHHIWSLAVYLKDCNIELRVHTKFLKKAIKFAKMMAPNLRRLTFADYSSKFYGSLDEAIQHELQIENNPKYQLPHFPKLVELTTYGLAVPIFEHLIHNNNHINNLKVSRNPEGNYNIAIKAFMNLIVLHLNFWKMEQVASLINVVMPYIQTLKFSYANGREFPDYSIIFDVIAVNWWSTLTYLNIHLPEAKNAKEYKHVLEHTANKRLDLPILQTLKLTIYQQFFLDFILPTANSLKKLSITQINNFTHFRIPPISKRDKKREIIKFVALDGRLRDSNIWELFPNLVYVYTIGCKKEGGIVEEITR